MKSFKKLPFAVQKEILEKSSTVPYSELSKEYNVTYDSLKWNIRKLIGSKYIHATVTEQEKIQFQELYDSGKSIKQISKILKRSEEAIRMYLKEDTEIRTTSHYVTKYSCNHDSFENIDTEEKAYFLGLMFADGYNSNGKNKKSEFRIILNLTDLELVEKFKEFLQADNPIYINKRSLKNPNWKDSYILNISSNKLSQDLAKLGCVQNKTFITEFPNISENLYKHFIRGYVDGDGYVSYRRLEITGTENLLLRIQEILMKDCNLQKTKFTVRYPERNNSIRGLVYGGNIQTKKILDYLYKDAKVYLTRKNIF